MAPTKQSEQIIALLESAQSLLEDKEEKGKAGKPPMQIEIRYLNT